MREIKFRGKDLKTKQWVYGSFDDNWSSIGKYYIYSKQDRKIICYGIDPNTVGQFTGLYDKNGKEIYEGDIISAKTKYSFLKYVVFWHDGKVDLQYQNGDFVGWAIQSTSNKIDEHSLQERQCRQYYEVVGNIHD